MSLLSIVDFMSLLYVPVGLAVLPRVDHGDVVGCDDVDLLLHATLLCQGCPL